MNSEEYVRKQIRRILKEQDSPKKKSSKKIRAVGVGRGRFKWSIDEAGALATSDPGKLMDNLNISKIEKSGNQVEMLQSLLEQAVSGTEEMSEIYSMPSKQPIFKDKEKNDLKSVTVNSSVIKPRDAQKYIEHTITGATSAFDISWDKDIEVTKNGSDIVVVFV
jgi:hypothetical protein